MTSSLRARGDRKATAANSAKAFSSQKLKANGAKMGKGSGQVVDDTASGDLVASLAVDYITNDKIEKGK